VSLFTLLFSILFPVVAATSVPSAPPSNSSFPNVIFGSADTCWGTSLDGYPTGDWRYTYRAKVLIYANSPLDFIHGLPTWNFLIEKALPEAQLELPVAVNPTAYLQYDSESVTNYIQGPSSQTVSAAQEVQSYTINIQCFDANSLVLPSASVLIQTSSPIDVHLNGQSVSLSVSPIRHEYPVVHLFEPQRCPREHYQYANHDY
jgi:hypothetical protein